MFVVKQNGRVIDRGFQTYQQAFEWVNDYVKGLESHKMGSKVYTPEFAIGDDTELTRDRNQIWRACTTHTQVRI